MKEYETAEFASRIITITQGSGSSLVGPDDINKAPFLKAGTWVKVRAFVVAGVGSTQPCSLTSGGASMQSLAGSAGPSLNGWFNIAVDGNYLFNVFAQEVTGLQDQQAVALFEVLIQQDRPAVAL